MILGRKAKILVAVVLVSAICAAAGMVFLVGYGRTPTSPGASPEVVEIGRGMGISSVASALYTRKIIDRPLLFRLFYTLCCGSRPIKAGEYLLSADMAPSEILDKLVRGDVVLHRLTVPEGYTIRQIARLVDKAGLADEEAFVLAATSRELATRLGIDAETLEGYLFPETYYFPAHVGPEKIIETMVGRFKEVFGDGWRRRARELGLTVHQVVTLASIIEKETASPDERRLISSVFHNRLARGMRLESDPTVIYGIKDFDGNLTREDLKTYTPYNTYRIKGLPPGPIANPGKDSLYAALYPESTDYLYFVSKNDGTHKFSSTLSEHNRAVRNYQILR